MKAANSTDVRAVMARLMLAFKAKDERALAGLMDRNSHTIRVWRSRGAVPVSVLVAAAHATGCSLTWLQNGEPQGDASASANDRNAVALTPREAAFIDNFRALGKKNRKLVCAVMGAIAKAGAA